MLLKLRKQSNVEGRAQDYDSDLAKKAVEDPDKYASMMWRDDLLKLQEEFGNGGVVSRIVLLSVTLLLLPGMLLCCKYRVPLLKECFLKLL